MDMIRQIFTLFALDKDLLSLEADRIISAPTALPVLGELVLMELGDEGVGLPL